MNTREIKSRERENDEGTKARREREEIEVEETEESSRCCCIKKITSSKQREKREGGGGKGIATQKLKENEFFKNYHSDFAHISFNDSW